MKTQLQSLRCLIVLATSILTTHTAFSQIDYQQDFSQANHKWTDRDFKVTDVAVCETTNAIRANVNNGAANPIVAETVSPAIGLSDGEAAVLTYRYKLLKYDNVLLYQPENDADWGTVTLDYGPTRNGPWRQIDAITSQNHVVSADCALRTITFTPADSTNVYLRFRAGGGINPKSNYYVYIDDVSVLQDGLTPGPIAASTDLQVYPNPVTDYLTVSFNGVISNVAVFDSHGREVILESVNNDLSRVDMTGLAFGDYTLKVTANNEVREVSVTKK
jgi:hypothetical protein